MPLKRSATSHVTSTEKEDQQRIAGILKVLAATIGSVPKALEDVHVFKDVNGPRLWQKLASEAHIDAEPVLLGSGTRGKAYKVGEQVLKITSDDKEVEAASVIKESPDPDGRASKIFGTYILQGKATKAYAVMQELLQPLDLEDEVVKLWVEWSDLWPKWSSARNYAKLNPENVSDFLRSNENLTSVQNNSAEWSNFGTWLNGLGSYLTSVGIEYHDFWHRNLLRRGNDFVAIDFGYSNTDEPEEGFDLETLSRTKS